MGFDVDPSEDRLQVDECLEEIRRLKEVNLQLRHRCHMADGVLVQVEKLMSKWDEPDGKSFNDQCYESWPVIKLRLERWQKYKDDAARGSVGDQMVLLDKPELAAGMRVTSQFKIEQDYGDGTLLIRKVTE